MVAMAVPAGEGGGVLENRSNTDPPASASIVIAVLVLSQCFDVFRRFHQFQVAFGIVSRLSPGSDANVSISVEVLSSLFAAVVDAVHATWPILLFL